MKPVKILDISDMQNGFTRENGNLYVQGARDIIDPINKFLHQVRNGVFDYTFIILDTHFAEEYSRSEEGKIFPLHCEFGTSDWELAVDVSKLPNKRYLLKNQFSMWGTRGNQDIVFHDPKRKKAYDTLFHILDNPHDPTTKDPRDKFIHAMSPECNAAGIEVTIIGVTSDYCNRYAMEGWLSRGARVTIIQDLTKGIQKETPEILNECQYQHYKSGRLQAVSSTEYLRDLADTMKREE
mgnify:CR=1 FL=1